jgi:hypothetical protein
MPDGSHTDILGSKLGEIHPTKIIKNYKLQLHITSSKKIFLILISHLQTVKKILGLQILKPSIEPSTETKLWQRAFLGTAF